MATLLRQAKSETPSERLRRREELLEHGAEFADAVLARPGGSGPSSTSGRPMSPAKRARETSAQN